jgi:hypothetical protein
MSLYATFILDDPQNLPHPRLFNAEPETAR